MKAIILAAGRGERLRPLTDHIPKPLLPINGIPLIEYHVRALAHAGFQEIVINVSHLRDQIRAFLKNGERFGVPIVYSDEGDTPLETGGGIKHALPLLGRNPFLVVNSDIWTDYPFEPKELSTTQDAHLVLVTNPPHNKNGDFYLNAKKLTPAGEQKLTFSGISYLHPRLFEAISETSFPLAPLLRKKIEQGRVSGEHYLGPWFDIGTVERYEQTNAFVANQFATMHRP